MEVCFITIIIIIVTVIKQFTNQFDLVGALICPIASDTEHHQHTFVVHQHTAVHQHTVVHQHAVVHQHTLVVHQHTLVVRLGSQVLDRALCFQDLTRFNKIATQGAPQMAVDKEANSLSRVYSYYSKFNLRLFYV